MRGLQAGREDRQIVLLWITGAVITLSLVAQVWLLPAVADLRSAQSLVEAQRQKHTILRRNIGIKGVVDEQFAKLDTESLQEQSDQVTLSRFLRDLEAMARQPGVVVVNMKPMPVKHDGAIRLYRVTLAVSGKIQDIVRFVSSLTERDNITGLESFSLRGVQGGRIAECSLSIRMVRLLPQRTTEPSVSVAREQQKEPDDQ